MLSIAIYGYQKSTTMDDVERPSRTVTKNYNKKHAANCNMQNVKASVGKGLHGQS